MLKQKKEKRINVRLVNNNAKHYKRYASKPSFFRKNVFSKNCVAIHEIKLVLAHNKPIYVRFSISDFGKYLMCEFHYNYIKTKYENCAKLFFTDRR